MTTLRSDYLRRLKQAVAAAALLAVFPLSHAITPLLMRDALPLCPFRAATGKPCPLCGLTRAIALATHGRWRDAFRMNPAWPLFAAAMIGLSILLSIDALSRTRTTDQLLRAISKRWIWLMAALMIFGVWRATYGGNWPP